MLLVVPEHSSCIHPNIYLVTIKSNTVLSIMNNYSTTPPKAVRAYTSYNLFFQLEREYILQTLLGHHPTVSKTDILFDPTDRTYYQGPPLPSRYQNLILPYDWHLPGKTQRRKRVHRKTHGKIGFHELNGRISSSWQVIDDEIRSFCTSLADIESIKYKKINKKTTTPKKSIVKKKTNIKPVSSQERGHTRASARRPIVQSAALKEGDR